MSGFKTPFVVFHKDYIKKAGAYSAESNPIVGPSKINHFGMKFYPIEFTLLEGSFATPSADNDWYESVRFNGKRINSILTSFSNNFSRDSATIYNPYLTSLTNPYLLYAYIDHFGSDVGKITLDTGVGGFTPTTDSFHARMTFAAILDETS